VSVLDGVPSSFATESFPTEPEIAGGGSTLALSVHPTAVARARGFVRQHSRDHGIDAQDCDTAVLLTSELVTNAVIHGRGGVCVTVHVTPAHLLVEVLDDNPRHPQLLAPEDESLNGRGLPIVCGLADACGTYPHRQGKVVWFRLDPTPAPG
jgi:anti-sigma regulatory factor (Ser/Thr protein kinase)